MADLQSVNPSTVAPSDSASATPQRKSKPGKAERAARRSVVGSQPGQQASAQKAAMFATSFQTPKPQPGKFPVVFQTGAGEPSRDQTFCIEPSSLHSSISGFPNRFIHHEKYNEFRHAAEIDDEDFSRDLKVSALLRLAQQVVHSHVNMGLPQGDFAPVASTEVKNPQSISAYIQQFGEFAVPALGTRYLFKDYESTIRSIVWCASQLSDQASGHPMRRSWLPNKHRDKRTAAIIAFHLSTRLKELNLSVDSQVLEDAIFSGDAPDVWGDIKTAWGTDDATKDRFDFLFRTYADAPAFVVQFTTVESSQVLRELGLPWSNPSASHVDWTFNVKSLFTTLSDVWARKSATYAQFFELSSSQTNRAAACGSQAQMAQVATHDSVTIVKTHLALSAPEFSLVACFPAVGLFSGDLSRRVVLTTPLSVVQRATEFVLLDWR